MIQIPMAIGLFVIQGARFQLNKQNENDTDSNGNGNRFIYNAIQNIK